MATPEELQRLHNPDLGYSVEPSLNAQLKANGVTQERFNAVLKALLESQFRAPMDDPRIHKL